MIITAIPPQEDFTISDLITVDAQQVGYQSTIYVGAKTWRYNGVETVEIGLPLKNDSFSSLMIDCHRTLTNVLRTRQHVNVRDEELPTLY
jgi:hypothetical protein